MPFRSAWLAIGLLIAPVAASEPQPLIVPTISLPGGATGLRAAIDGHPGLFLFDTGAGVTLVTPAAAGLSRCHPWGQVTGFRATGERLDTPRCDDLRLTIAARSFKAPTASILDLQPMMGPSMPPLLGIAALDLFAGRALTIRPLAHELIVETPSSLRLRIESAHPVPIRLVRDAEGLALTVDAAVPTRSGLAWMELDTGNAGPILLDDRIAPSLPHAPSAPKPDASFTLAGGIPIHGPARISHLILDGDVGASVLDHWDVTFDLASARAWFRPATPG